MTGEIKQIADRLKDLREIYAVSTESLANEIGIPITEYVKYESGDFDIPIGLLYKISNKFEIELTSLLSGDYPKLHIYSIVRKGQGLIVERRKKNKYENLAFNYIHKKTEPFLVTVNPETDNSTDNFSSHQGQEFNYVIEGSLLLSIDNYKLVLREGDSVYFDSSYNHVFKALNNSQARFIAIIIQ